MTLSRVITSCGGTSSTTVRRLTRTMRSMGQATMIEPGALGLRQHLAEAEDDAALVLVQDLDREQQPEDDGADDEHHR